MTIARQQAIWRDRHEGRRMLYERESPSSLPALGTSARDAQVHIQGVGWRPASKANIRRGVAMSIPIRYRASAATDVRGYAATAR